MLDFLSDYQLNFLDKILLPAIKATFEMLIYSTILSVIFGFFVGVLLVITNKGGILENRIVYRILSFIVNVVRSFPVIILIVFMLPVTKLIVGHLDRCSCSSGSADGQRYGLYRQTDRKLSAGSG